MGGGDGVLPRLQVCDAPAMLLRHPKERSRARGPPGPVRLRHCLWGGDAGSGSGAWQRAASHATQGPSGVLRLPP